MSRLRSLLSSLISWIRWAISKIPIYGQLINSSKEAFRVGFMNLIITTLFSLLPLWVYPTIVTIGFGEPFWGTVRTFVAGGELFIYSAALIGPLIYAIMKTYGEEVSNGEAEDERSAFPRNRSISFPYGVWFVLISIVVCCFAALLFGIMRAKTAEVLPMTLQEDMLICVSILLYAFTLSCIFCVSVYRENLERIPATFGRDTIALIRQWEHRDD